jgi:hypothetical protein
VINLFLETMDLRTNCLILSNTIVWIVAQCLGTCSCLVMELICMHLDFCDILIELTEVDLLFEPANLTCQFLRARHASRHRYELDCAYISSISAGVRRATSGRINQAIITTTAPVPAKLQHRTDVSLFPQGGSFSLLDKAHLQESRLDTPFMGRRGIGPVDHKRCAKAEHNASKIGSSKRPGSSLRTQALLRNLSSICVANCRSATSGKCS